MNYVEGHLTLASKPLNIGALIDCCDRQRAKVAAIVGVGIPSLANVIEDGTWVITVRIDYEGYQTAQKIAEMQRRLGSLIRQLNENEIEVVRYKIESTNLDSAQTGYDTRELVW